jgi:CubicO group peptidase (beta-lactamase class C family)
MKKRTQSLSYKYLIFFKLSKQVFLLSVFCITMFFQTATVKADLPVAGVEVPELEGFDTLMQSFMADKGINSGILAISKDRRVVYQRGFGYAYNGADPLPENTPMRLASVSKPHTAAAIRYLIADGIISLDDFAFSVPGQILAPGQRALLDASTPSSLYYPYNGTFGDNRFGQITIQHLLLYQGGWDSENYPDPMYSEVAIGQATGVVPPGKIWTVKYTLSQPLHFTPGDDSIYCNFGYMLLSLIIEQETGFQHTDYIRHRVLTPDMWVPATEVFFGRTFEYWKNPRETRYIGGSDCKNVYDPDGPLVECPYGSFDLEQKTGEGNLVASAAPLLTFLDNYSASINLNAGLPISSPVDGAKNGGFAGTNTRIEQYADGFSVVILFAKSGQWYADELMPQVRAHINFSILLGVDWDSLKAIDGFWVDFNESSSGFGGFDDPFHTMDVTLSSIAKGSKLRFKGGSSNWTGTISTRTLLNAPFGTAIIGQ